MAQPLELPQKGEVKIEFAERFSITRLRNGCRLLEIKKPVGRKRGLWFTYLLVPKGQPVPKGYDYDELVSIPVRTVTCASGFHVSLVALLGHFDAVVGVSGKMRVGNERIHEMLDAGEMAALGDSQNMNMETLVETRPDVAFIYGSGSDFDMQEKIHQFGITPGLICAHLEAQPLGVLEWIKFIGAFFQKEAIAQAYFDSVKTQYLNYQRVADAVAQKPGVIVGHNRKGAWTTHGSSAWFVQFLLDAGANYILEPKNEYEENVVSLEVAIQKGIKADYWVNPQWDVRKISELLGQDKRYGIFKSVQTGQVYNNNASAFNNGRNRFWETGMMEPQVVLADLIKIFHPELLPEHKLVYYRKLD
ncbi:ABC transporter substrate-binding protein [Chloroherpeton thalassium]|uniref:ABC transporter substrate-binding protein n=1 Tax=Chloroherpeton thalassium TaxID=100716 RepID=UPI001B7F88A5|nr:ABC transporter substrate-binding protein [Chloroherpeton thalassium]